jgi:hypothetical protein
MSYYRTLDRDAFAKFRTHMRKGGNIVPLFGQAEAKWDDPLYAKADLAARLDCHAINGRVLVAVETRFGPDYDGHATPRYHEIPATVYAYRKWLDRMQEESEGVDFYTIVSWFSLDIPTYWANRGRDLWYADLDAAFTQAFSA